MANALAQSDPISGNALAQAPLGTGLAQGAADIQKLYPVWQQQYIDGQTQLQFAEWLKQQGISNPVMPR
jgi:hypothetical protein